MSRQISKTLQMEHFTSHPSTVSDNIEWDAVPIDADLLMQQHPHDDDAAQLRAESADG